MHTNSSQANRLIYADGEMAEQIRSFNWASTPLGAIENWPGSLRQVVNQMLDSGFPMLIWWGKENIQIYNDRCMQVQQTNPNFKNFKALGQYGQVAWPKLWPVIQRKKEIIFSTAKAMFIEDELIPVPRNNGMEDVYWTYSFDPIRNDEGEMTGLLAIFKEATKVNRRLQQKEEEQAFLLTLSDHLRAWSSPEQIEVEAMRMLGEYLGADRAGFAEAHEEEQLITIKRSFVKEGISEIKGTYQYKDYGYGLYTALKQGQTVIKSDIAADPDLNDEQKTAHKALQLGATVNMPLLKAGRLLAVLFVHYRQAHDWSAQQMSILSQSAGRIWDAVLMSRAEEELRTSEERYRTLFNSIDEAFMVIEITFDAQGQPVDYTFLNVNPAFEKQSGLSNVVGKTILQIMPDIEHTWIDAYGRVAVSGKPMRFEEYNQGTGRWYDVYAVAVRQSASQVMVVFDDITERKQEEQRKNDFLSMASHELKTPLTSVNGYLHILKTKLLKGENPKAEDMLERTTKQISKMTGIINSFLNIARLDAGKIAIQRQPFNVVDTMREAEEEAVNNNSSHRFKFEPGIPALVNADREKISQVIENFISNAVKYSPAGSVIELGCVIKEREVKVSVKDEGIGLTKDDVSQVFKRFYRVENERTSTIAGFGIGLYICREIIERHGGIIGVESEAGKGSTFWFSLPVTA